MQYIIFLTCLLLSFGVNAQQHFNKTDEKGKQGFWVKTEKDSIKVYEGYFINNKPTGKWVRYYPDGKTPLITMEYIAQTDTCNVKLFSENNRLTAQGKYFNQKRHGLWKYYNEQNKLIEEVEYKNGKEEGISRNFNPQGVCIELTNWVNGKKEGKNIRFNHKGKKEIEEIYSNNRIHGFYSVYYENGKIQTKGEYLQGRKTGTWINYSRLGIVTDSIIYNNGVREDENKAVLEENKRLNLLYKQKGRIEEINENDTPF